MSRAERRRPARVRRRVRARRPAPPLPIGLPLLVTMLVILVLDRALGLTAFTIAPDSGSVVGRGRIGAGPGGVASVLADLVTVVLVLACLLLVRSIGRPRSRSGFLVVLLGVVLVALQLGSLVAGTLTGIDVPTDLYLARGLLLTGMTVASMHVIASLEQHRSTVTALREVTASSESLAASGREALADLRADVTGRVREVLEEALATLQRGPGPSGADLRALAQDVLRPLSHRLAEAPARIAPMLPEPTRSPWRTTLRGILRAPVVPVRTLALMSMGLAFLRTLVTDQERIRDLSPAIPVDVTAPGPVGVGLTVDWVPLVAVLGELAVVLSVTWWGARRLARLLAPPAVGDGHALRPAAAWGLTAVALLGIAGLTRIGPAVSDLLAGAVPLAGSGSAVRIVGAFVPLLAVTVGVSVVAVLEEERGRLETDLAHRSTEAARVAARVQAVLAHEQQRIARALHADVQSTVNAAGLVIDRAARDGELTAELVEDVAGRIATSVERFLEGGASKRRLIDRIEEVRGLWAGVCDVRLDAEQEVRERIDADPVSRELLVDIVAEACANAVVHGDARNVTVRLMPGGSGEVDLEVRDDGRMRGVLPAGPDGGTGGAAGTTGGSTTGGSAGRGLGSEVLRRSCTRFVLDGDAEGTTLSASVPLA